MNKLTERDLMVGDWVTCSINNKYYKVSALTSDIELEGDEFIFYSRCDDIEPIPITSELLEKNFTYDTYGIYFFGDDYLEVYIKEYTDGLWRVEVDEIEMSSLPTWRMFVSNVNELQHALRLAGIDKEITI